MRLGLWIEITRICSIIANFKLVWIILIVGILSCVLVVVHLILWELDWPRVHIIDRNFIINVSFYQIVMLVVVSFIFLSVELSKLLRRVNDSLLMKFDFVFCEHCVVRLQGNVGRWRAVLRVEPLKVSVLNVRWLSFDLQLICVLIVVVATISAA